MSSRLFIGNLSYNASEDDLRAAFVALGYAPRAVTIVTDRETGQPRGFGFVELESPEKAREAKEVANGAQVAGRAIRVDSANERERSGGGGGFSRDRSHGSDRQPQRGGRERGRDRGERF